MMKAIPLERWPEYLLDWVEPNEGLMARSPRRREIAVFGEVSGTDEAIIEFPIGKSRDGYGTVLHLAPADPPMFGQKPDKDPKVGQKRQKQWNLWWAKIAVRSGYLGPTIDPGAIALLDDLRRRDARVEFIVDTNVLISGVGHWLVRCFGDVCDLVRTVVTDLEVQRFGDRKKWIPAKFDDLTMRATYLAASRFLEYLQEQHPVWRRLDIEEETALFVASASSGDKEPGADTLLLRAVRRALQDQVPGLRRLFVTSDQSLARAASHDLPVGSTVAAYVPAIPDGGTYLSSVRWWPKGHDGGAGHMSTLAAFCYEATCLCDSVRLVKGDSSFLRVRSSVPDRSQFPTDWRQPTVWVEEGNQTEFAGDSSAMLRTEAASQLTAEPAPVDSVLAASDAIIPQPSPEVPRIRIAGSTVRASSVLPAWPLASAPATVTDPVSCVSRFSAPILMEILAAIMLAARESRSVSERIFPASPESARELRAFLRAVNALDSAGKPGPASNDIEAIFASNDTDALSRLLTRASEYNALISEFELTKELCCGHH